MRYLLIAHLCYYEIVARKPKMNNQPEQTPPDNSMPPWIAQALHERAQAEAGQPQPPDEFSSAAGFVDQVREHASDVAREIAADQAEEYEVAVLNLMRRTGDDPELANSLRDFVSALQSKSFFGDGSDRPLGPDKVADLVDFLGDATRRLRGQSKKGDYAGWNIVRPGE
jgi:hypothetical protein